MHPNLKRKRSTNLDDISKQQKFHQEETDTGRQQPATTTTLTTMNSFDSLVPILLALRDKCTALSEQMTRLQTADESLLRFNDSFGAFLFGLSANSAVTGWPELEQQSSPCAVDIPLQSIDSEPQNTGSSPSSPCVSSKANPLKFVCGKINIESIIDRLPLKYREQSEYRKATKTVLQALGKTSEGIMVEFTKLPKHRVADCLNAVIRIKDVIKFNPKGQLAIYRLNPSKYPSI